MVAASGRRGQNLPTYLPRALKESVKSKDLESGSLCFGDLLNQRSPVIADFSRRVVASIWNRSLFRSNGGSLGLARKDCEVGDLICILYGCSVPVFLRRKTKSDEAILEELREDEAEFESEFEAIVIFIQRRYRNQLRRRYNQSLKNEESIQSLSREDYVAWKLP